MDLGLGRLLRRIVRIMAKTIGILTGGGDVPGLNPCIKAVVYRAMDAGNQVIGFRRGWAGMLNLDPDEPESIQQWTLPLTKDVVRTIDRTGGTFLHTSRTHPGQVVKDKVPAFLKGKGVTLPDGRIDLTSHVLKVLSYLGVDALIPIGGDDTISYGHRVHAEGFPVVAVPKTMDNDVFGTDYCIGFSTAITRSVSFIHQLRTSVGSHERIGIIELFGRNSGETSLISAYLSAADRAIISEVPFDPKRLSDLLLRDKRENPSNYAIMTISEGARMIEGEVIEGGEKDAYGHRKLGGIGVTASKEIKRHTGQNIIYQQLAYLMRSGAPDALDLMVATNFGTLAVDLINRSVVGRLVVVSEGRYSHRPLDVTTEGLKRVDVEMFYDSGAYRPKVMNILAQPMFLT